MNKIDLKHMFFASLILPFTVTAADFTITTDADFDAGTLQSLNHDAPNNDQLQISSTVSTFPVIWIANAGEDSVSKIDTDAECETARYETWFSTPNHSAFAGPAPSRTAVDANGNVFIANRHFDGRPVSVLKILLEGGVDRNGNGVIDTSSDANNDCVIQPSEMIPLVDTNGNGILDDAELADERVAFVEQIAGTTGQLGRSLCIAPSGNIWAGTFSGNSYYELSPVDGSVLNGPINSGSRNYGCVVDGDGILYGASLGSTMPIIDTNTRTLLGVRNHGGDYAIAFGNGRVYKGRAAGPYLIYDPNVGPGEPDGDPTTGTFSTPPVAFPTSLGVGVDGNGDIVQGNTSIRKFDGATNTLLWASVNPGASDTRGVVADSSNNVWAVNRNSNNATKFRGSDGQFMATIPTGFQPYTYSDATGIGFQIANPNGIFVGIFDGVDGGAEWDRVAWNTEPQGNIPAGATITVETRAADSVAALAGMAYVGATNGAGGLGQIGRFLQVRAVLTPDGAGTSPILSDILASTLEDEVLACDIDVDNDVDINDIRLITAARNTPADPNPGDPRDIDGNGIINVLDARQCTLQCTLSRCASP